VNSLRVILRWKQVADFGGVHENVLGVDDDGVHQAVDGCRVLDDIPSVVLRLALCELNADSDTMTMMACVRCLVNALINDEKRIRAFCGTDFDGIGKLSLILSTTSSRTRLGADHTACGYNDPIALMKLHVYIIRLVYMMIAQWYVYMMI